MTGGKAKNRQVQEVIREHERANNEPKPASQYRDQAAQILPRIVRLESSLAKGGSAQAQELGIDPASLAVTWPAITIYNPLGPDLLSGDEVIVTWISFYRDGVKPGGIWVPTGASSSSSNSCTCDLIDLLEANDHLIDITVTEWSDLKTSCECLSVVQCAECIDNEMPNPVRVLITGTNDVGQITTGNTALGVDWMSFLSTHDVPMVGCSGSVFIDCGLSTALDDFGEYPVGTACRVEIIATAKFATISTSFEEVIADPQAEHPTNGWEPLGQSNRNGGSIPRPMPCKSMATLGNGVGTGPVINLGNITWMAP